MNPIEIEEAVSQLVEQPFDADEFPFAFLDEARKDRAGEVPRSGLA